MKCLMKDCKKEAVSRGLCRACYQTAWVNVYAGNTTWEKLEKVGMALPPRHARRGFSPFAVQFRETFPEAVVDPVRIDDPPTGGSTTNVSVADRQPEPEKFATSGFLTTELPKKAQDQLIGQPNPTPAPQRSKAPWEQ